MEATETLTVAEVVGRNAQRLRGDHKIDELAKRAQFLGLKWNSGRVSDLERGRVSPTIPTLFVLCMALSDLTGRPIGLADLVEGNGDIKITDKLVIPSATVADALRGLPADAQLDAPDDFNSTLMEVAIRQAGGEAEQRAAQSLGISGGRFTALAQRLWGRTFAEERDSRAGSEANAQKRGRVARELKAEMRERLGNGDD